MQQIKKMKISSRSLGVGFILLATVVITQLFAVRFGETYPGVFYTSVF
jgi:hypothetical protein